MEKDRSRSAAERVWQVGDHEDSCWGKEEEWILYQLTVCLWDLAKTLVRPLELCQSEFMVELVIWRAIAVQIKPQGLNTKLGNMET